MRAARLSNIVFLIGTLCIGETAMAQEQTVEELEADKKRLTLEKEVIMLRKDILIAQAALEQTQTPGPPTPTEIAAATKAEADALKAQYDAQKAAAEAQTAADTARIRELIGTVPTSGIDGSVTIKQDAGKSEATLLAAIAIQNASEKLAVQLIQTIDGRKVYVFAGAAQPQVQNWRSFVIKQNLLRQAFEIARANEDQARAGDKVMVEQLARVQAQGSSNAAPSTGTVELPALAVAGTALQALQNLGSFFQTNYEVGAAAATADEQVLTPSIVKYLVDAKVQVFDPSRLSPAIADQALLGLLSPLDALNLEAAAKSPELENLSKVARTKAGATGLAPELKQGLENVAAAYERAAAMWKAAAAAYEALKKDLATPDTSGVLLAAKIAQEKTVSEELEKGALALFLKVNAAVGSYYTKKNVWTFLGKMPYSVMGGVVVSFTLVDGNTGRILLTGVEPVHSGYHNVNAVEERINVAPGRPRVSAGNQEAGTTERMAELEKKILELEAKLPPASNPGAN